MATNPNQASWVAYNYCLGFIDLLGQRDAMHGQGLLPVLSSEEEKATFRDVIRQSIGSIYTLQRDAEAMHRTSRSPREDSPLRKTLSPEQKIAWDEMQRPNTVTQRWSDGFVIFSCLGEQGLKSRMGSIFDIFGLCGSLCFLGLARRRPIRGAVEASWGVELKAGELYGPVVARAYELESEVAKYPRIVVGRNVIGLLDAHRNDLSGDVFSQFNRDMAQLCMSMMMRDVDGVPIIHYLGEGFRNAVTQTQHQVLYARSLEFVTEQLAEHRKTPTSKLAFRYVQLLNYFNAHRP
jgi:hypothetical protein